MKRWDKNPALWPIRRPEKGKESQEGRLRQRVLFVSIPLIFIFLVVIAALIHRSTRASVQRSRFPTNENLAHDPNVPRIEKNVYDESIDEGSYTNRDLKLSIRRPEGWEMAIGSRPEFGEKYDGLVVKMIPQARSKADPDSAPFQPVASVVRRKLPEGLKGDPAAYIESVLLSGKKEVIDPPARVTVNGSQMVRVAYRMTEGRTELVVTQYVSIKAGAAYTLTLACRREEIEMYKDTIQGLVSTFQLGI